jgi:hypothetical protein
MKLLTSELYRRLLTNGRWNNIKVKQDKSPDDFPPVVKLFCPWSAATWRLTELDPQNPEIAFGLCDLGIGTPSWDASALPKSSRFVVLAACVSNAIGISGQPRHYRPTPTKLAASAASSREVHDAQGRRRAALAAKRTLYRIACGC